MGVGRDIHEINALEDKLKKWESELIFPVSFDPMGDVSPSNILAYVKPMLKVSAAVPSTFSLGVFQPAYLTRKSAPPD